MAPLIFLLAIEPLSRMLQRKLVGLPVALPSVCSQVALAADDVMILCADENDVKKKPKTSYHGCVFCSKCWKSEFAENNGNSDGIMEEERRRKKM